MSSRSCCLPTITDEEASRLWAEMLERLDAERDTAGGEGAK